MIDTRKQFQLQTGVFLKRPDVVAFDDTYEESKDENGSSLFFSLSFGSDWFGS